MPVFSPRRYQPAYLPLHRDKAARACVYGLRAHGQGRALRLPHVRQLHPAGDSLRLPNDLPHGPAQRPLRRRHRRNTAAWTRRGPAPGTRSTIAPSGWGALDRLLEINAPLDGNQAGHETWLTALRPLARTRRRPASPRVYHRPREVPRTSGTSSSTICASPTGGRAMRSITRPPIRSPFLGWRPTCAPAPLSSRLRSRRR